MLTRLIHTSNHVGLLPKQKDLGKRLIVTLVANPPPRSDS